MQSRPRARRGFSLVELMLVLLVIFMLMGLLIGGFRFASRYSKRAADRAAVNSLKQAISQFEQQVGFAPPLVKDLGDPLNFNGVPVKTVGGENRPDVYLTSVPAELEFLRTAPDAATLPDMRFSIYTYAYYLVGACDVRRIAAGSGVPPMDGVPGPGFLAPRRDGTFERSGKRFESMFDVGKNGKALVTYALQGDPAQYNGCRVELRDSKGIAYRFYRWEHGKAVPNANGSTGPVGSVVDANDLNVPPILGNPAEDDRLKNAKWAILGAGPDGIFGNEDQLPDGHPQKLPLSTMATRVGMSTPGNAAEEMRLRNKAMEDNIVEVGQ